MNLPMTLNGSTYKYTATTSSGGITLAAGNLVDYSQNVIIYNDGSVLVAVKSGASALPTATVPGSASVPVESQVVAPGAMATYSLPAGHGFIAAITASSTADLYISVGNGV